MKLTSLTDELAAKYELTDLKTGALITAISPRSAAARSGLRVGDVITKVDKTLVKTAKQATEALTKGDTANGLRLSVTNREGSRLVFLRGSTKE